MLLPSDLLDFWCATGGGDIFESETILRPAVSQSPNSCFVTGDDTDTQNSAHRNAGMPAGLFIFHIGSFLSAIVLENQRYVTLRNDYSIESEFVSLDDWYLRSLRAEFSERYGLDVAPTL
jgi:hypothetical protein